MGVEENKKVARQIIEEVRGKGNTDLIPELFSLGYLSHGSGGVFEIGYESLMQHITRGHTMFPDFQMTVEDIVAEGDKVTCRATMTGTHHGKVMGIAPTGKKVSVSNIGIMRFKDGKVIESWGIHDGLSMWHQLGVAPPGFKSDSK